MKLIDRWIQALRSGEYAQGTGELYTPEGTYCCLGVLTHLHNPEHPALGISSLMPGDVVERVMDEEGMPDDESFFVYDGREIGSDRFGRGTDWAPDWDVKIHYNGRRLADMNDSGFSFEQIAEMIEATLR